MAFSRSYSKVWWGSDNNQTSSAVAGSSFTSGGYYSFHGTDNNKRQLQTQPQEQIQQQQFQLVTGTDYHSLDLPSYKANLSCIQEVDDEQNISRISWQKHDSPGSLRSQDSGFSDNEESQSTRSLSGRSAASTNAAVSPGVKSQDNSTASPKSIRSIATPPTVIRRVGNSAFYSPLVSVTRRISFNAGANSPNKTLTDSSSTDVCETNNDDNEDNTEMDENTSKLFAQLDSMQLTNDTPKKQSTIVISNDKLQETSPQPMMRRRKRGLRKAPNTPTDLEVAQKPLNNSIPAYNNETVYLGEAPPPYNNETVILGGLSSNRSDSMELEQATEALEDDNNNALKFELSPLRGRRHGAAHFTASTSTPNAKAVASQTRPQYTGSMQALTVPVEYDNPLLNGHTPDLQSWVADLRMSYDQEVMSTLQTKSIAQEAFKNLKITTGSVAKLVRQLQQHALELQTAFERNERILTGVQEATLHEALSSAGQLIAHIADFTRVLERRAVFFTDSRADRRRYEDHLEQIRLVTKDTRYSLERQHYINLESLLDDVQVLKRNLLITIRLIFEKMVRIIVQSIEQSRCDMLLRANINMIATLSNIDYDGFASLTDAFVQNEAVRALLVIVLDHRQSSVRALALRALSTICCAPEAIAQLGCCGGIEIVRDILLAANAEPRGDIERREAVSLLAQITAAWHGPAHRVDGLKDCAESLVAGLAELITPECCPQTLLLCAAALNNLSRMEPTSHYSIMSNEAIFKLISAVEARVSDVSVFLDEQIVVMLHNMSLNKKCHSHLANGIIINFITSVYQTEFYKKYGSRAENEAQRRCIKAILHTLTRLVQDSNCPALGAELVERWRLPEFFMMANSSLATSDSDSGYSKDISQLARQLLHAHQQEQLLLLQDTAGSVSSGNQTPEAQTGNKMKAVTTNTTTAATTAATTTPTTTPKALAAANAAATTKATLGAASGLTFNLTRQESFV